jgi:hypothetical protein
MALERSAKQSRRAAVTSAFVAAPDVRGDERRQAQHLPCPGGVGADDVWIGDCLGQVRDGAVEPSPDVVPDQRRTSEEPGADRALANDSAICGVVAQHRVISMTNRCVPRRTWSAECHVCPARHAVLVCGSAGRVVFRAGAFERVGCRRTSGR